MYIPHIVYSFICQWTHLAIANNAAMNMGISLFLKNALYTKVLKVCIYVSIQSPVWINFLEPNKI